MKDERSRYGKRDKENFVVGTLIFLELVFFSFLFLNFFSGVGMASVGSPNATISTTLEVGTVPPEIINITINDEIGYIDLSPNATVFANVYVIWRDYNGENDTTNMTLDFFDDVSKNLGDSVDNNDYYYNSSCVLDVGYGDGYYGAANCTVALQYYAFNSTWNATVTLIDNSSLNDSDSASTVVNTLLAVGLPNSVDFGTVNATEMSAERTANVTNFGNVRINISLSGYGNVPGDNLSMNCSLGSLKNISIEYAKYNLSDSNLSSLTYAEANDWYLNLTTDPVTRGFDLDSRLDDTAPYLDETNATYWRMYVPLGVAGTCNGNIVIGATQSDGI